ncbi:hypothetical protein GPJ56_001535 [Histomonas meleagridis]|uniref:uncharacterized protein n=1 Tax=Histomonas meleagridis TaxID=135588 RepID=UPI00355A5FA1|nr:hypothetical protein GPJ56_001535 [Histomonas meleagridis]KAH0807042.1 hypothetical protein GO595_000218 [Histomonas meleagridis]
MLVSPKTGSSQNPPQAKHSSKAGDVVLGILRSFFPNSNKNTFKPIEPNLTEGCLNEDEIKVMKKQFDDCHVKQIYLKHIGLPSIIRLPVQVAVMEKGNQKPIFLMEQLKRVLERAGTKPIIFVSALGRYQQGKSSTIAGLTGNLTTKVGDGVKEQTDGVFIDGPYTLDHFYERFRSRKDGRYLIKPRNNLSFKRNDTTIMEPVIFFFDIEGYAGSKNDLKYAEQIKAFRDLVVPFMALSSVYFMMADSNPAIDEIKWMIDGLNISSLTNSDPKGKGHLGLIVPVRKVDEPIKKIGFDPANTKTYDKYNEYQNQNFAGSQEIKDIGLNITFIPLYPLNNEKLYIRSFRYFAAKMIRAMENAAESEFIRDANSALGLFDYVVKNCNSPDFVNGIRKEINDQYNSTISEITCNSISPYLQEVIEKIDNEFNEIENSNVSIETINKMKIQDKYLSQLRKIIKKILGSAEFSEGALSVKSKFDDQIQKHIDEKYQILLDKDNERKAKIEKDLMNIFSIEKNNYITNAKKLFTTNESNWNLQKSNQEEFVNKFIQNMINNFGKNYKDETQKKMFNNVLTMYKNEIKADTKILFIETQQFYEKIKNQRILAEEEERLREMKKQEEIKKIKLSKFQESIPKITKDYRDIWKSIFGDLQDKLKDKDFYLSTYENVDVTYNDTMNNVKDALNQKGFTEDQQKYVNGLLEVDSETFKNQIDELYQKAKKMHGKVIHESASYLQEGHKSHIVIYRREVFVCADGKKEYGQWEAIRVEKVGWFQRKKYTHPPYGFFKLESESNKVGDVDDEDVGVFNSDDENDDSSDDEYSY